MLQTTIDGMPFARDYFTLEKADIKKVHGQDEDQLADHLRRLETDIMPLILNLEKLLKKLLSMQAANMAED
eukprot:6188588-Alexandrium_andersonii.AAC.1